MKKNIIFILVITLLFSCSSDKKSTDEIVKEIKNGNNLTEVITKTSCGDIVYKLDGKKTRHFFCDSYMGDGGVELNCYFEGNKLIYSEYYSFYDGPMQLEDGTFTSGGEAIGDKYKLYFENEKLVKCLKNDELVTDLNTEEPDYDPDTSKLVVFAKKVKKIINTTDSEVLCDSWF